MKDFGEALGAVVGAGVIVVAVGAMIGGFFGALVLAFRLLAGI